MLYLAVSYYFFISMLVFTRWLKLFISDSTTEKTDAVSWISLMIGTSLWPIVLPFAYLELLNKISKQRN